MASGQPPAARWERTRATSASLGLVFVTAEIAFLMASADAGEDSDVLVGGNVLGMVLAAIAFLIVLAAIGWGIYEVYQIGHPAVKK